MVERCRMEINKVNMRFIEDLYTKLENEGRDQVVKKSRNRLKKI